MNPANDDCKFEPSPLTAFREARRLSREELVSIAGVDVPTPLLISLSNTVALTEASLLSSADYRLAHFWQALDSAGHGELRARQQQWYDAQRSCQ